MTPSEGLAQVAEKLPDLLATLPPEEPPEWPSFVHGRPTDLSRGLLAELMGRCLGVVRLK
jgi:hypothetical protein